MILQTISKTKFLRAGLLFVLFSVSTQASTLIAPTPAQSQTTLEIINKLTQMHYAGRPVDDQLSSQLLDNYLSRLDSGRNLFLASDISEFEHYRTTLDDDLLKGNLESGFVIFNRYQERLVDRITQILDSLPTLLSQLDFEANEQLLIDRSTSPWPADSKEADELWSKMLKSKIISLRLAKKDDKAIIELLEKRYRNQLNRIKQSNGDDTYQVYINSLTELYDPHTNYLSPRTSENFNINMSLSLEGIGAVLQQDDEYTKVVRLVPAGPAAKRGELQPSDRIVGVAQQGEDFVDVIGMRLDEVVDLIRGPKDSTVKLEIIPVSASNDDEHKIIEIKRDTVKLEEQSAQRKLLEINYDDKIHKIGVIDLPTFYRNFAVRDINDPAFKSTSFDVMNHINALGKEGAEGIIIDLRDNGGGSLDEANALTSLFIEAGATVQIRHSSGNVDRAGKSYRSNYFQMPMVVLINRLSASASEIFAGAIQDYKRGLIVGTASFGKGTVQSINELTQGQLKITESKFYRVSGESTQHRGVVPDIEFPAIYDKEKVGESSLDHALAWDTIQAVPRPFYYNFDAALPLLKQKHLERAAKDPDFIFMEDRLALSQKTKELSYLTLNINERKKLNQHDKDEILNLENKRRIAKGLDKISELETDDGNSNPEANHQDEEATSTSAIDENDPFLLEAGKILLDSMPFYINNQIARRTSISQ